MEACSAISFSPDESYALSATNGQSLSFSRSYKDLLEVVNHAVAKLHVWPDQKREVLHSKLDERFLTSIWAQPPKRNLSFFPDLHFKFSKSWKAPYSSRSQPWPVPSVVQWLLWWLTERHLWLSLLGIREKEKSILLDTPISPSGLFSDAVSTVFDRFQAAKKQSEAFWQFIPCQV